MPKFKTFKDLGNQLRLDAKAMRKERDRLVGEVGVSILTKVSKTTPWLSGRARYNWQTLKNTTATNSLFASEYGKSLGALTSITRGVPVAMSYNGDRDKSLHISNALVYIGKLNEGHSKQAPPGFVGQAVRAGLLSAKYRNVFGRRTL